MLEFLKYNPRYFFIFLLIYKHFCIIILVKNTNVVYSTGELNNLIFLTTGIS